MNKRQAKKQFKKKYGCTPDECAKNLQATVKTFCEKLRKMMMEAVSDALVQSEQIQEHEDDC